MQVPDLSSQTGRRRKSNRVQDDTQSTRPYIIYNNNNTITYTARSRGDGGLNVGGGAVEPPRRTARPAGHDRRTRADKIFMNFNFAV